MDGTTAGWAESVDQINGVAWAPDGSIVMMEGTVLHRWAPDAEGWQKVADLGVQGLASATRVAVSPDGKKLAVVGVPVTPADDSKASSDE